MPNDKLCGVVAALVLCVAGASVTRGSQPERPNILFFYVDDMGWGAIGPNGQAARRAAGLPWVRTPHIDRLASEGINFTRGYGCTVCSPARSSLQTGFHQGHTFADRNDPNNAKKAIRADDPSIGQSLSRAGYVTGYWGKWGYGGSKDQKDPIIENVQTLPTSHGYQFVLAELHHVRAHTFFQPTLWRAPAAAGSVGGMELTQNSMAIYQNRGSWPGTPARQNHRNYPTTAYCDDSYAFAALDFVRTQGQNYNKTGQPFHGLLAVQIPHAPFGEITALPKWNHEYADDAKFESLSAQTKQWAAMVTRIDSHFGNILAALDDPDHDGDTSDSIAANTLVVFQSDNGGPGGNSHDELDTNGGLSGVKGRIQEGGIRVPLVMRWPAKITAESKLKAGTNCDMIVDVTDLLPTFCDLAGVPAPVGIDGVSIAPTLTGNGRQRQRKFIIHEAGNGQSIIRGQYKLIRGKKSKLQLFDLEADRTESQDIAAEHPRLVRELEALLLGERVAEPKGFANTYHQWTGDNHAQTDDPDNWSDYRYSNAGITYLEDSGAPQLSWIAHVENSGKESRVAHVSKHLEVLGLRVRGNARHNAAQSLTLGAGINLTGRNEIRMESQSSLTVNGGTVSSLRWIDIQPAGTLTGHGTINATVYNSGTVAGTETILPSFVIHGDYHESSDATLSLTFKQQTEPAIRVAGTATLAGTLKVMRIPEDELRDGQTFTVMSAKNIVGRFTNADNEVVAKDGRRFLIEYSTSHVNLTVQ